ncbi:MAG: 4-hydroxythreonine-4-phosphate dehydrogenase PdxA [Verrucomicrobiota bacterium]|nr:4-hydroxythreonine-4-phosphate dehydrogenase PdxA [Verrucomicrobiota bacterium]
MKHGKQDRKPLIGVTMGDPAGVGPELCLRMLLDPRLRSSCVPVVFGDRDILTRVAKRLRWNRPDRVLALSDWETGVSLETPGVIDCGETERLKIKPGVVQAACGRAACVYIRAAVRAALAGRIRGIATAPIHKKAFLNAGIPFTGHTELLANLTVSKRFCMMMASEKIIVSLVTAHRRLAAIAGMLTKERVSDSIALTAEILRQLGRKNPRIGVCGLNPHAGEQGILGSEEIEIIVPAIESARSRRILAQGPLAPDTAFLPARLKSFDAYVAMYHDQGLIPFKMLSFETGVNITLGLPIARTSVDHGTAFDIAWKGIASPESLVQSVLWAKRIAEAR